MENLIFLIFVIVISILSSILKKKAPPAPKQKGPDIPGGGRPQQQQRPQPQSGKEILAEVEKILRGEMPEPEYTYNKAPEPQPVVNTQNTNVEEFTNPEFSKPMVEQVKTAYEVDQKEYTTDAKFQYKDTRALEFSKKMRDVNSLKEYLLMSEVLGKPKALKRR